MLHFRDILHVTKAALGGAIVLTTLQHLPAFALGPPPDGCGNFVLVQSLALAVHHHHTLVGGRVAVQDRQIVPIVVGEGCKIGVQFRLNAVLEVDLDVAKVGRGVQQRPYR
jgi:hypothetical protein